MLLFEMMTIITDWNASEISAQISTDEWQDELRKGRWKKKKKKRRNKNNYWLVVPIELGLGALHPE